jgi:DNA-binding response OmpR family regulator
MNRFALLKRIFRGTSAEADRRKTERVLAREGLRVLIIDDSATIVAVLSKLMRQNEYVPIGAGDAEQGLEIAARELPDLIFLDIVLPGMNGFAALRALRRNPVTHAIPVIMISGNAQATEQFYAQRIGADDFMKKPFGRAEVFSRIEQLVASGRLPARAGVPAERQAEVDIEQGEQLISDDMPLEGASDGDGGGD